MIYWILKNLLGAGQECELGGGDGREVQKDRKFMFLQDFQSPGEKNEADVCDDLIQGCPQILIVHAI